MSEVLWEVNAHFLVKISNKSNKKIGKYTKKYQKQKQTKKKKNMQKTNAEKVQEVSKMETWTQNRTQRIFTFFSGEQTTELVPCEDWRRYI